MNHAARLLARALTVAALALGALSGCASTRGLAWSADTSQLRAPPPTKYPDADAAYLLRERRIVLTSRWSGGSRVEWQVHNVLAILTEKGFAHANVRVEYPEKGEIIDFEARTIGPDGEAVPVSSINMHDDTLVETKDDASKTRVFAFPNVKVGSVLEYRYTVSYPGMLYALDEYLNDELPVESYVLELAGTRDIRYQTKIYHTDQKWEEHNDGGDWTLRWSAKDIPPTRSESLDPDRSFRDPFWVFTVLQLAKYNYALDINRSWASAYDGRIEALQFDNEKYYDGFTADLKVPPTSSAFAKVGAALDWIRTRWRVARPGSYPGRKAKTLDDRGDVTGVERTRVLYKLLRDQGLTVEFAVTNRAHQRLEDRDVPWPDAYGTLLLYLPKQAGLPAPLWLDGACDFCGTGEIPWWLQGREAMVLHAVRETGKKRPVLTPEWVRVEGPPATDSRFERRYTVVLRDDLSMTLSQTQREIGQQATVARDYALRMTAKDLDTVWENTVKGRLPAARLTRRVPYEVAPGVSSVSAGLDATDGQYVLADGDTRVVPLTVLAVELGDFFEKNSRTAPVVFRFAHTDHDEAILEVPTTWAVRELPPKLEASAHGVTCRTEATAVGPGRIKVTRHLSRTAGERPASAYAEIRAAVRMCASYRDQALTFAVTPTTAAAR